MILYKKPLLFGSIYPVNPTQLINMNNLSEMGSKIAKEQMQGAKGGQGGEAGAGGSGGQSDYLDKGLNSAEQKYGGKYYDAEKVKPANKKATDKIKEKFHSVTGHNLPGTH
ncbi:hypothetical protein BJX70DRAFT_380738 [Aspergillus crustosus]